jgi:3'-phosphoadenosine 5'-phosphosulfate sulfotransferase (PAPS reductase)/FAD synthetase
MDIREALPTKKYTDALKHSTTPEFKAKVNAAIGRLQSWRVHPGVDQTTPAILHFSFGKDSQATAILARKAGIEFEGFVIDNLGDFPGHELIVPEFLEFFPGFDYVVAFNDKRYIDVIKYWLDWAKYYNVTDKKGKLPDFFDWGRVNDQICYEVVEQFELMSETGIAGSMRIWGNRGAEGMERYYEVQRHGMFYLVGGKDEPTSFWRCLPISDWRDIDVWALLVSENCPVSEIYSKHALPMGGGKKAFPRTVFWAAPEIWNPDYYKWLSYYYPALLKEAITKFPEIKAKFAPSN